MRELTNMELDAVSGGHRERENSGTHIVNIGSFNGNFTGDQSNSGNGNGIGNVESNNNVVNGGSR